MIYLMGIETALTEWQNYIGDSSLWVRLNDTTMAVNEWKTECNELL